MQFIKGQNIPLTLQLIKADLTSEDDATITYDIYDNDLTTNLVSTQSAIWNSSFNCYFDDLDVTTNWLNQADGNYILKWNISDTDLFSKTMIENICIYSSSINIDSTSSIDVIQINDKLDSIQTDVDNIQTDIDVIPTNVDTELTSEHGSGSWLSSSVSPSDVAEAVWDELYDNHNKTKSFGYLMNMVQDDIKRTLGLMHENIHIDLPNYDDDNNLIGARVRIYSTPDRVGTDLDIIGEYNITSVSDGAGKFTTWQQTKTYTDEDTFLLEDGSYLLLETGDRFLLE